MLFAISVVESGGSQNTIVMCILYMVSQSNKIVQCFVFGWEFRATQWAEHQGWTLESHVVAPELCLLVVPNELALSSTFPFPCTAAHLYLQRLIFCSGRNSLRYQWLLTMRIFATTGPWPLLLDHSAHSTFFHIILFCSINATESISHDPRNSTEVHTTHST